uniref:Uncharacterized protein n=1 Tax=Micrurus lemniscatus lemniscatus TaxID=129467 RepID=A0A2D4JDB2_MICLE
MQLVSEEGKFSLFEGSREINSTCFVREGSFVHWRLWGLKPVSYQCKASWLQCCPRKAQVCCLCLIAGRRLLGTAVAHIERAPDYKVLLFSLGWDSTKQFYYFK